MPFFTIPPPPATVHLADHNHFTPGRVIQPQLICLHSTVGTDSIDWLTTTPGSNASAHRLIKKDGTNYILVQREDTAWTNGPSQWFTSPGSRAHQLSAYLTIEFENLNTGVDPYPDAQLISGAWTCAYWWSIYGALPIVGHTNVQANKTDPRGFPYARFYTHLLAKLRPNA